MGLMKLLLIAAVIVVALYFVAPPQYLAVKNTATSIWHSVWEKVKLGTPAPTPNATTTSDNTSLQYQAAVTNPAPVPSGPPDGSQPATIVNTTNTTGGLATPSPIEETPACSRLHHGFPNYASTSKAGDTCISVPTGRDEECLANPPTNYDGEINPTLHYSNPALACCAEDGQCRWN